MDVTALLNANSTAVEQQRKLEKDGLSKAPARNRTPWDAGGYSLPINTLAKSTHNALAWNQNVHLDDSQATSATTPTSPHHKFSDSQSSLSSFTSSLQSTAHSRFSSTSTTISGTQPFDSLAENISPVSNLKIHEMDLSHLAPSESSHQQSPGSLSPTASLNADALPAEHMFAGHNPASPTSEDKTSTSSVQIPEGTSPTVRRPSSPSDAVLIKRATLPSLRLVTRDYELNGSGQSHPLNRNFLSAPIETHHRSLMHSRNHKRALSAPDFGALDTKLPTMAMRPLGEPTPPSSRHPDIPSPTPMPDNAAYPNPDTPPVTTDNETHALVCMYISDCDTKSQLRKAISHIFGRNKMCTRMVPSHVWVHYCRKHYQRSRYRNPKEYAKLQCDLVQQQIRRVHEWSLENAKKGVQNTVRDWGLSVRKREQKRLDDLGGCRKRNATTFDQDSDAGEDDNGRPAAVPATAVPEWLLDLCGKGYSTHEILDIFNRLHSEILEDTLPCFPDIEILPNIVVDQDEPKTPKGHSRRPALGHRRAQSLGVGMKSTYQSPVQDCRLSQPAVHDHGSASLYASPYASPNLKRRRQNEMHETMSSIRNTSFPTPRHIERSVDSGRQMVHYDHPFADNEERGVGEHVHYVRRQYYGLQAPTPQRPNSQSMAAHLETGNEYIRGRPLIHQRSRSDVSAFRHRWEQPPGPTQVYMPGYTDPSPYYQQPPSQMPYESTQLHFEPARGENRQPNRLPKLGHHRARSSSTVPLAYSSSMPTVEENQTQIDLSPYNTSGPRPVATQVQPQTHIMETQEARAVFSSRR